MAVEPRPKARFIHSLETRLSLA